MAFSYTLLGAAAARVQSHCDLDGQVPERGDHWQQFRWNRRMRSRFERTGEWELFVSVAIAATAAAHEQLRSLEGWP